MPLIGRPKFVAHLRPGREVGQAEERSYGTSLCELEASRSCGRLELATGVRRQREECRRSCRQFRPGADAAVHLLPDLPGLSSLLHRIRRV